MTPGPAADDAPIEVVPYDPAWPESFRREPFTEIDADLHKIS